MKKNTPRRNNQNERLMVRRPCINYLRTCKQLNQFKGWKVFSWTCPPDQGKLSAAQASAAKLDGYEKGVFDLTIFAATEHQAKIWIVEFKTEKGRYTPEQKLLAESCEGTPIKAIIVRNVDEFQEFIKSICSP